MNSSWAPEVYAATRHQNVSKIQHCRVAGCIYELFAGSQAVYVLHRHLDANRRLVPLLIAAQQNLCERGGAVRQSA